MYRTLAIDKLSARIRLKAVVQHSRCAPCLPAFVLAGAVFFTGLVSRATTAQRQPALHSNTAEAEPQTSSLAAYAALHLLPSAPPDLIKAAHCTLAQLHHPDKGGDLTTMQKINAAYETLRKRLAA